MWGPGPARAGSRRLSQGQSRTGPVSDPRRTMGVREEDTTAAGAYAGSGMFEQVFE